MRLTRAALVTLSLLSLALAVPAADPPVVPAPAPDVSRPPVVVVVDSNRVLEGSKYAQMLQGRLKGLEESIRSQLGPMQESYEKRRTEFEAGQGSMTPEQKEQAARSLADLESQLQNAGQQAQQAYNQQRDSLAFQMRQALEPVLDALGKEKGWDLILSRPGADLVWYAKRLDVTDLVIERLNAQPMPEAKPAAASPAAAPSAGAKPKH